MEIFLSRYRLPFREPAPDGVYYIPQDFQADMASGNFSAHVQLWRHQYASDYVHHHDYQFLDDLYYEFGVRAAGRISGRNRLFVERVKDVFPNGVQKPARVQ